MSYNSPTANIFFQESDLTPQTLRDITRSKASTYGIPLPSDSTTVFRETQIKEKEEESKVSWIFILGIALISAAAYFSYRYFVTYKDIDKNNKKDVQNKDIAFYTFIIAGSIGLILCLVSYLGKKEFKPESKVVSWTQF